MNKLDHCKCYSIDNFIGDICKYEYKYFFAKPHVEGIGLGYKIRNGFYTWEKCIKVFVSKKISENELPIQHIIPTVYKNIKTDVVESGIAKLNSLTNRIRPVAGGYSIGPAIVTTTGTMGCLVTDGYNEYILGNNHVLAVLNTIPLNTPIIQPGVIDGGVPKKDIVGILSKYIPLKPEGTIEKKTNTVDCAIAKIVNKSDVSSRIAIVGYLNGTIIPVLGRNVKKVGRTTGLTTGKVEAISVTYKNSGKAGKKEEKFTFIDQIIASTISKNGDSGAMLMDNNNNVMGMLMSSTDTFSIYNNINNILKQLNVRIVTR